MIIEPRQYQIDDVTYAMNHGIDDRVIHCSPTGSGKTVIQALICKRELDRGDSTAILTPRNEIFDQTYRTVADLCGSGNVSVLRAKRQGETWNPVNPVHIVSWPTLIARAKRSNFWFPKVQRVLVDECFTGDVEILTEYGFVRFDLYNAERVAQISKGGSLSFTEPLAVIQKDYSGRVIEFVGDRSINLTVTENHDMLVRCDGQVSKKKAKKITTKDFMPTCVWSHRKTGKLLAFERLLIALQADGSMRRQTSVGCSVDFHFKKTRKVDRLMDICRDGGFALSEVKASNGKRRFLVNRLPPVSKNLWDHFSLENMDQGDAKAIIDEMVHWDGHICKTGNYYFSSVDERATEFYQCVAIMAGYKTNKTIQIDNRKKSFRNIHRLFISKDCNQIGMQSVSKAARDFSGKVYCVNVPDGQIVVRRNGKPVVTGNCHLSMAPKILEILHHYAPKARIDGYTATPARQTGTGLGRFFTEIKHVTTVRRLIDDGFLAPCEYYGGKQPDLAGIKISRGDYEVKKLSNACVTLVGDAVDNWFRLAEERQTIVFAVDIAHCEALAERYQRSGVRAAALHTGMDQDERDKVVTAYKTGRIQVLCNVSIASYGFDSPETACVQICRPTKSIVLHLQMIGRGMRPKANGGTNMVLDHAGNVAALGFADDLFRWRLDDGKKACENWTRKEASGDGGEEAREHECENCHYIFSRSRVCPKCGWKVPFSKREVATADADLVEIGKNLVKRLPEGWPSHEIFYGMLKRYGADKGYQPGWAAVKFKEKCEVWPERHWMNMASIPPSPRIINWIISRNIAYAKGKKKANAG